LSSNKIFSIAFSSKIQSWNRMFIILTIITCEEKSLKNLRWIWDWGKFYRFLQNLLFCWWLMA
jgi:hypothetical protein